MPYRLQQLDLFWRRRIVGPIVRMWGAARESRGGESVEVQRFDEWHPVDVVSSWRGPVRFTPRCLRRRDRATEKKLYTPDQTGIVCRRSTSLRGGETA